MNRRQMLVAVVNGTLAFAGCEMIKGGNTLTSPSQPSLPQPQQPRTVGQALGSSVTWECHRQLGSGVTAVRGQIGGYLVTINGDRFGEMGPNRRIDLQNWPINPGDRVELRRETNTPVVTVTTRC